MATSVFPGGGRGLDRPEKTLRDHSRVALVHNWPLAFSLGREEEFQNRSSIEIR